MIKLQITKSGEIVEFESVKDWEKYILENMDRDKINKGHLYNLINGKSKSCYGFKLFSEDVANPKILGEWKYITISDSQSIKDFVTQFLMEEYGFKGPEIEYGIKAARGCWGFFSFTVKNPKAVGLYLEPSALRFGQDQAKGTLIHEALHYKLFVEKKKFSDGMEDFENELKRLKEKYPQFKITSNHNFQILHDLDYKGFINERRKQFGLEQL